jgi:competence protein ComEA
MNWPTISKSEMAAVTILAFGAVAGLLVGGVRGHAHAAKGAITITTPDPSAQQKQSTPREALTITVHVAGAVARPGLIDLPMGSRVNDAIKLAGGAKPGAYLDGVNLAAVVRDGEQIFIPSAPTDSGGAATATMTAAAAGKAKSRQTSDTKKLPSGTININSATKAMLTQLPGVGEVTADRIIAKRRELGRFATPEQLMDVSGIGPKKFEKMKPYVRTQ